MALAPKQGKNSASCLGEDMQGHPDPKLAPCRPGGGGIVVGLVVQSEDDNVHQQDPQQGESAEDIQGLRRWDPGDGRRF